MGRGFTMLETGKNSISGKQRAIDVVTVHHEIRNTEKAVEYCLQLHNAGLLYHFDDSASDCLGHHGLTDTQLCSIQGNINRIDSLDWSYSVFDGAVDVALTIHNEDDVTGGLYEELAQWQEANSLPKQCPAEQLLSLELNDPRRSWLADYGKRWNEMQMRLCELWRIRSEFNIPLEEVD